MITSAAISAICALGARHTPRPGTRGKYIAIERQGLPLAILLPEAILHSQAVNLNECKPLGAGFYWLNEDDTVSVEGRSQSLNVASRPEDAEMVENALLLLGLL